MLSPSLTATIYQHLLKSALHITFEEHAKFTESDLQHRRFEFFEHLVRPRFFFENELQWLRLAYQELQYFRRAGEVSFDDVRIPVVGQSTFGIELGRLDGHVTVDRSENGFFFWGRVPLAVLLNSLGELIDVPPEQAYLDLGTPLRAGASKQAIDTDLDNLLDAAASGASFAQCGVAIVDLGEDATHGPNDYKGKLRHAVTNNIDLSDHAKKVLATLLERIGPRLSNVTVSCALVRPPAQAITTGSGCFDQATTVELMSAISALDPQLNADNKPAAINISLGTHVGPHNGDSPVEEFISTKLARPYDRFVVVAAGNDGESGLAAKRQLEAGTPEYLKLRTGPQCVDLLVEFWWYEAENCDLTIKVNLYERRTSGGRRRVGAARLRAGKIHQTLSSGHLGFPASFTAQALFHSKCRNELSCAAFSLSRMATQLPILEIEFELECNVDTTVNAWIVLCEPDPETTFIQGNADGTVRVPATAKRVVSVSGNDSNGKMWINSSRGPSAEYGNGPSERAPLMSHLAFRGTEAGTSFASPRACADVLETIATPSKLAKCSDEVDLLCETYPPLTRATLSWNRRSGYHKETS